MSELPGPIRPTSTQTIGGLYAETFLPTGTPKGVVVVTHGYAEHCGRYHEVCHVIVNAGWAALTYDCRGHGKSPGPRGFIDRFDTYATDLHAMIAAAKKLVPETAPVVLLGHSHGSLITLYALASDNPPKVRSAIVASPYLGIKLAVPAWKKLLARVASRVAPRLNQPNGIKAEHLTDDLAKRAEHDADPLNFATASARWFVESSDAQDFVLAHADRITVPTTWLVGANDPLANPAQSRTVANKVKGATYHDLVGMKHEVFNEVERGKVFAELARALATA
ncbi:MAG: lysophospholipase [Myxococcales bacterium]|nr:lysophospholipase [Myxococcales bacterium]